jgi:hypothetical protein
VSGADADTARSIRAAAATIGVTPIVIRRWIDRGDLAQPPWPLDELRRLDVESRPSPGPQADHGTLTRYAMGCNCDAYLTAQRNYQRKQSRVEPQAQSARELLQQLVDALGADPTGRATGETDERSAAVRSCPIRAQSKGTYRRKSVSHGKPR